MKTRRKAYLIILLIVIGMSFSLGATNNLFSPTPANNGRSWRLTEQITQIDSAGTWTNQRLDHNYYNLVNPTLVDSTVSCYFNYEMGWLPGNSDCFSYDFSQQYITEILTKLVMMETSYYGMLIQGKQLKS